jgi:hypothetical protein
VLGQAPSRELLQRDGLVIEGREGGMRPHPAAAIERDSRIVITPAAGVDNDGMRRQCPGDAMPQAGSLTITCHNEENASGSGCQEIPSFASPRPIRVRA